MAMFHTDFQPHCNGHWNKKMKRFNDLWNTFGNIAASGPKIDVELEQVCRHAVSCVLVQPFLSPWKKNTPTHPHTHTHTTGQMINRQGRQLGRAKDRKHYHSFISTLQSLDTPGDRESLNR